MQKGGFRGSCNYTSLFFGALILALAALLSAGSVAAQTATGTVTGTVTDPKGLPMTDATVLVHNTDTGADQSVTTNDAGRYVVPQLQPGHYELTASKSGFATAEAKGLDVGVGHL
jgi:protocatechuate 3,4-dioxygenase beta subunit